MTAVKKERPNRPNIHADPLLQRTCLIMNNSDKSRSFICNKSGVAYSTIKKWEKRITRRPMASTLRAVLKVLGYELAIVKGRAVVK